MNVRRLLSVFLACLSLSLSAQESLSNDSITGEMQFCPRQLILPAALISVGAFGVENGWFCSLKQDVREGFQDLRGDSRFRADDKLQYLPVIANVGLGLASVKSRHPLRERIVATATAYAALGAMVRGTKHVVKEKRPDSGKCNSFPSGHTATAFMGAELVREEYGNGWGTGAYAFATGIAFLRLYNDRHWLNDVIAGAGIGMLSARIGYWLLPWERRVFGWEKQGTRYAVRGTGNVQGHDEPMLVLVPSYNPELQAPMLCFTASF